MFKFFQGEIKIQGQVRKRTRLLPALRNGEQTGPLRVAHNCEWTSIVHVPRNCEWLGTLRTPHNSEWTRHPALSFPSKSFVVEKSHPRHYSSQK